MRRGTAAWAGSRNMTSLQNSTLLLGPMIDNSAVRQLQLQHRTHATHLPGLLMKQSSRERHSRNERAVY